MEGKTYFLNTFPRFISLNEFHDYGNERSHELAIIRLNKGNPPCDYCWFITGSGGRIEQGLISDQDHGMIFEIYSQDNEQLFFRTW